MCVSQRSKGSGEVSKRPPNHRGPKRLGGGCVDCGGSGGELGLDRNGLCAECGVEGEVAHRAVRSLIDHGIGVSRGAVEAL